MNKEAKSILKEERRPSAEQTVENCLMRTAEALGDAGVANGVVISGCLATALKAINEGKPRDLIELICRRAGTNEEGMGSAVQRISQILAAARRPVPPVIPFASKLIAPSAFYDLFDGMHSLGRKLLVPVLYAEDTDSIGTGSVNPIAAEFLAEEIRHAVSNRFGIRPFTTSVRMDYESWTFLCRKHFELER